jgi:signal peptidase II
MNRITSQTLVRLFGPALLIIALDQLVKIWVHNTMAYGMEGQINVLGNWFKLHYTLNPGMAFGMQIGEPYGKIILTTFRLVATAGFVFYLLHAARTGANAGFLLCISLVLGGAIGNLIDSVFYGVLLGNAPLDAPTPWLHGQVIDMFYFDIWEGILPDWLPVLGGQYYSLWPIFNVADASIFCGILAILLFQSKFFPEQKEADKVPI